MNEVYFAGRRGLGSPVTGCKRLAWGLANWLGLGGLFSWGVEEHWLRIERLEMPLTVLPADLDGWRIAHISDLHCGPLVRDKYLRECMDVVNRARPDFVCVTGDLITGGTAHARRVAEVLRRLRPRVATVACLGNHDYGMWHPNGAGEMRGLADCLERRLTEVGIYVLRNESATFRTDGGSPIQFVGLEDLWAREYDPPAAFRRCRPGVATVTLCHNPDAAGDLFARGAEWVLAGHTHGKAARRGRLAKLLYPVKQKRLSAGLFRLGPRQHVYVNRGLAHSRRVGRQQCQEITLLTLRRTRSRVLQLAETC